MDVFALMIGAFCFCVAAWATLAVNDTGLLGDGWLIYAGVTLLATRSVTAARDTIAYARAWRARHDDPLADYMPGTAVAA